MSEREERGRLSFELVRGFPFGKERNRTNYVVVHCLFVFQLPKLKGIIFSQNRTKKKWKNNTFYQVKLLWGAHNL
jgi:hypothetical protein